MTRCLAFSIASANFPNLTASFLNSILNVICSIPIVGLFSSPVRALEIGQQSCLIEKAVGAILRGAPCLSRLPRLRTHSRRARVPKPKWRVLLRHRLGLREFPRVIQDFAALIGGLFSPGGMIGWVEVPIY